jgi:transcriptional regulator with XRE-family HTH domain
VYDLKTIEQRIMAIAKQKKLSKNKLLQNVQLNKSVFDNMKKGQIPSIDKIHIIADYLDCSIDYLVGRTDVPEVNGMDFMGKAVLTDEELWEEMQKEKKIDDLIERLIKEGELTEDESAKIKDVLK